HGGRVAAPLARHAHQPDLRAEPGDPEPHGLRSLTPPPLLLRFRLDAASDHKGKTMKLLPLMLMTTMMLAACASPAKRAEETPFPGGGLEARAVDIKSVRGHDQPRFAATAAKQVVTAQQYFDRQILKEGTVDNSRYTEWLQRVSSFVTAAQQRKP